VQQLGERAEKVRGRGVDPAEDNMLKITGDGRKAALDMHLITGRPASTPTCGRRWSARPGSSTR
jgi:hypothetical protein